MEGDQSSLLESLNFRCLLCTTEILSREQDEKNISTGITEEFPKETFANNKALLLLSSLWNCLTDRDSTKQDGFPDNNDFDPESSIHFCPNCENYLVEFEQLRQQISSAQRRLSTVKYTVTAKFLSASEIQTDDDLSVLLNHPKCRAIREKLKKGETLASKLS